MKAIWIIARVFLDYLTGTSGIADLRYWACCISIWRSVWNDVNFLFWKPHMDSPRAPQSSNAMSGQRDCGTSPHTVGGSASRSASSGSEPSGMGIGEVRASPRSADYLLLRVKTTQPMSLHDCLERDARWARMHAGDVFRKGRGKKTNLADSNGCKCAPTTRLSTKSGFNRKHAFVPDSETRARMSFETRSRRGCGPSILNGMAPPRNQHVGRPNVYRQHLHSRHTHQRNRNRVGSILEPPSGARGNRVWGMAGHWAGWVVDIPSNTGHEHPRTSGAASSGEEGG